MIGNETQEAITMNERRIKEEVLAIESLKELAATLKQWPNKIIDRRFFEKFFPLYDEAGAIITYWAGKNKRDIATKYKITPRTYSFEKPFKIMLSRLVENDPVRYGEWQSIHLNDKTTAGTLAEIEAEITARLGIIEQRKAKIIELSSFDESALVTELQALYLKYGKPDLWDKVLGLYEVRNPKTD
jgi:hypothetical protein